MRQRLAFGWLAALGSMLVSPLSYGATPAEASEEKDRATAGDESEMESSNVSKTRQGSLLRRDKPLAATVDLRGELERRRDFEVLRHYTRVAELDAIEDLARAANDTALGERVETVRRKEQRRFIEIMQRLREMARQHAFSREP